MGKLLRFSIFAIVIYTSSQLWAGESFPPVTADELKMTSEPAAPGAPAIYIYRQVDRDDNSNRESELTRIKILTEEGRKYANIEIPFVKGHISVHNLKARTYQPDGRVTEFNDKVYEKTVVKAKGIKFLAKTLTMPDVHVGSIVEYSFDLKFDPDYVFDSHWLLSEDLFTKRARFSLKPNRTFSLKVACPIGLPSGVPIPSQGAHDEVQLEAHNIPSFETEDYMPPENDVKYRVEFIYSQWLREMDPTKFWRQINKSWYAYFNTFVDKRKAMEQAIAQIIAPGDGSEVKLQKIYARAQQIRNLTFERRKTDNEQAREKLKDIQNVEEVWKRGYGDARDINWLFIALARAAGFEASPVYLAGRRSSFNFNPKLLNPNLLNADVVLVKLEGKDLYLDPGAKFAPFGLLPWFETQVQGLLLNQDDGKWIETALPDSSLAKTERKANLVLAEDGTLEGSLTLTLGGLEALEIRTDEREDDDAGRKAALEEMVKEAVPAGLELELTNKPDWNSASSTLVAEYHVKISGLLSNAGRRDFLPLGLFGGSEKRLFEHAERVHPIYFHHPYLKSDDITINLPPAWKVSGVPAAVDDDAKTVAYITKAETGSSAVHVTRLLRCDLLWVPKNQYIVLRHFFQTVRTGDEQQIVLQSGTASPGTQVSLFSIPAMPLPLHGEF